jgi:hypothetical protein
MSYGFSTLRRLREAVDLKRKKFIHHLSLLNGASMNFKQIAAAVAILAVGTANAAVQSFDSFIDDGETFGNGSLILIKADTTGATQGGLTIDLGFNYSDFADGGALAGANNTIVWNFSNNTITKNGALVTGVTNSWSAPFAAYAGNAAETKWSVLSGSQAATAPNGFLSSTSKTLTAADLAAQDASVTGNMVGVSGQLLGTPVNGIANLGTFASADNGAYAMGSTSPGFVGTAYNPTNVNGWKNNIQWNTWSVDGGKANLWQLNAVDGTNTLIGDSSTYTVGPNQVMSIAGLLNGGGTFTLSGDVLTYQTASITAVTAAVPEPESFGLALIGLAAMGFVARRRAAK